MYLCIVMVTTGTFYGVEQSSPAQDIVASFCVSLFSTLPTLIIKKIFEKSKPREVKSEKHDLEAIIKSVEDEHYRDGNTE